MLALLLALAVPAAAAPSLLLFKVSDTGGLCPGGPCVSDVSVAKDGSYVWTGINGSLKGKGKLPAATLKAVAVALAKTDFKEMKSRPFTDLCPTAYDGNERTYTFRAARGEEVLPSCRYALDKELTLLKLVDKAVADIFAPAPKRP